MNLMKKAFIFLFCLMLSLSCAAVAEEEVQGLPLDFSGGKELLDENFIGEYEYKDPTLHIVITQDRKDECDYWVARIKVSHPSQLRTISAGGYDTNMSMKGPALAKRVNAALAIDGDYYCYTGQGYILRQGELYLDILSGDRDVLLIDEDGDFHILVKPQQGEVTDEINGKKVVNAFFFGPALVIDGEMPANVTGQDMSADEKRQRMCIAQVGPLEYMAICCEAPARGSYGMTLKQFAELVESLGVENAYNLDGGDSTMMIFNGEKINDPLNHSTRSICDIIYFASAWEGEE